MINAVATVPKNFSKVKDLVLIGEKGCAQPLRSRTS
jgi:hypothetical protein